MTQYRIMRLWGKVAFSLVLIFLVGGVRAQALELRSGAFDDGGPVPVEFTCRGRNVSPPLSWSAVPEETKSLVLITEDPDAPGGVWIHWVMWNIPPGSRSLKENVPNDVTLADGSVQGVASNGTHGYHGPCPPSGRHRYYFRLYALDRELDLDQNAGKDAVTRAMTGHVLAKASLLGYFSKQ